jgi:type II secretory pathway component PulF
MPAYAYIGLEPNGKKRAGVIDAASSAAAAEAVEQRGLMPVRVDERAEEKPSGLNRATGRVRPAQVHQFLRQLAGLLTAGVPLSRSLEILGRESTSPAAKALWRRVRDEVSDGTPLAEAMSHHPRVFAPVHVAMVRAGETGGFLDVVLRQIAEFMSRERDLKGRVVGALIYPLVLACVATGVVTFLLSWFIPKFSLIFEQFGQSLPVLTRIVQGASFLVRDYGPFLAVLVAVMLIALRKAVMTPAGRRLRDKWVLKVPAIGHVTARFALVRFCRMLGTLLGAGVPLITSLRVAREAIGNQVLADALEESINRVQRGDTLAHGLSTCPGLFPPSVLEVIAVAEESGQLSTELDRLGADNEQELDRRLRLLVSLAEPALLFVMAAIVGTIVIGMLLPVFDLWDAIQ